MKPIPAMLPERCTEIDALHQARRRAGTLIKQRYSPRELINRSSGDAANAAIPPNGAFGEWRERDTETGDDWQFYAVTRVGGGFTYLWKEKDGE